MIGLARCELPLIGPGQQPAQYTVRLHLIAPAGDQPGQRVFDVKLQSVSVAEKMDVAAQAGGAGRAFVAEYHGVPVTRDLVIELVAHGPRLTAANVPVICGIEVLRAGADEIRKEIASK